MSQACTLCPNLCGADRKGVMGLCLASRDIVINRAELHFYEEPPISGKRGSGTVFFGGCTMKCVFCQNYAISRLPTGKTYTPKQLADVFRKLEDANAHNINLVTPTHYSDSIKRALDLYRPQIPIVYNTSGYELKKVIRSLKGYIDIYLPDFKYSNSALAAELSGRPDYPHYALDAIAEMLSQKSNRYDAQGIMQEGVLIRHLILPGELSNSYGVLDLIKQNFGHLVSLSLMSQFTPIPQCTRLPRSLKPIEYKAVIARAQKLGFENTYIQALTSAKSEYTPHFDISV